jgi:thiol-disulfide isomerase/thioredoxin
MRYRALIIRAAIALLAVTSLSRVSAADSASTALTPVPSEHASPPTLLLKDLNGVQQSLADFSGKVLLVNFWATWCPPCVKELPLMQALRRQLADEPFEVIAVNVGEGPVDVSNFLKRLDAGLDYPILLDENMVTAKRWKVRALPTTYIIDPKGRARYLAMGERDFGAPDVVAVLRSLALPDS